MNVSKAVLVTGCSSGIGRATAGRLAEAGWRVYATARNLDKIAPLERSGCELLSLDVTDEDSMISAIEEVERREGAVGVLVNNAGYSQSGAVEAVPMDKVQRQFETIRDHSAASMLRTTSPTWSMTAPILGFPRRAAPSPRRSVSDDPNRSTGGLVDQWTDLSPHPDGCQYPPEPRHRVEPARPVGRARSGRRVRPPPEISENIDNSGNLPPTVRRLRHDQRGAREPVAKSTLELRESSTFELIRPPPRAVILSTFRCSGEGEGAWRATTDADYGRTGHHEEGTMRTGIVQQRIGGLATMIAAVAIALAGSSGDRAAAQATPEATGADPDRFAGAGRGSRRAGRRHRLGGPRLEDRRRRRSRGRNRSSRPLHCRRRL